MGKVNYVVPYLGIFLTNIGSENLKCYTNGSKNSIQSIEMYNK